MMQEMAASSLFIGVLGCWMAVLGFRDIFGYFRIFLSNVLHMFYTLTDVLHFNNLRICFRQE
jgi:hypothetical protein